jgi:hypothetical protein
VGVNGHQQFFADQDYELAVVPPEARVLPARFDERSIHIETTITPDKG